MADKDEIDEGIVEKVGQGKAIPLLPQEEEEPKELVIHVPEDTAKSAEIGALSVLVIIIVIAAIAAVVYFVLDRRRQKKIKACVEKIQKSEEGKPDTGKKPSAVSLPPPLPVDDPMTETATSDEAPESDVNTEVTMETDAPSDDANNNQDRNDNAKQRLQRLRRCCLCLCCPDDLDHPSLEEVWRQKQAKLKEAGDDGKGARESLRLMEEGMKHMEGYQMFLNQPRPSFSDLRRHGANRRRSHRNRSQSQPATSRRFSSVRRPSNENRSCWSQAATQRRCRSHSTGRHRQDHHGRQRKRLQGGLSGRGYSYDDRRQGKRSHIHSVQNPEQHRRHEQHHNRDRSGPGHVKDQKEQYPAGDYDCQVSQSPGYPVRVQHRGHNDSEGYCTKSSDRNGRHFDSGRARHSRDYYEEYREDISQSCVGSSRSDFVRNQREHNERHHLREPNQSQHTERQPDREMCTNRHERGHYHRGQNSSGGDKRHHEERPHRNRYEERQHGIRDFENPREQRQPDRRLRQSQYDERYLDRSSKTQYEKRHSDGKPPVNQHGRHHGRKTSQYGEPHPDCRQNPSQYHERFLDRRPNDKTRSQRGHSVDLEMSSRHRSRAQCSPDLSGGSFGNLTVSSLQNSEYAGYPDPAVLHYRDRQDQIQKNSRRSMAQPQPYENRNQSAYWSDVNVHSTPKQRLSLRGNHSPGSNSHTRRTIPNTYYQEQSPHPEQNSYNHYDPMYSPCQYSHLNVSQNQHCEDNELIVSNKTTTTPHNVSPDCRIDRTSGDAGLAFNEDDEGSIGEVGTVQSKTCRKRTSRRRCRKVRLTSHTTCTKRHNRCADENRNKSRDVHDSQKKTDTASLVQKIFGLKVALKVNKLKSRVRREVFTNTGYEAGERRPLLNDDNRCCSEDLPHEVSNVTDPVDSGCDISTSLLSDTRRQEITHSSTADRKNADRSTSVVISRVRETEQRSWVHVKGDSREEEMSLIWSANNCQTDCIPSMAQDCKDTITNIFPIIDIHNGMDNAPSVKRVPQERTVCMGLKVTNVDTLPNDDDGEFRRLATLRWCEQQCLSLGNPSPAFRLATDYTGNEQENGTSSLCLSARTGLLSTSPRGHGHSDLICHEQRRDLPKMSRCVLTSGVYLHSNNEGHTGKQAIYHSESIPEITDTPFNGTRDFHSEIDLMDFEHTTDIKPAPLVDHLDPNSLTSFSDSDAESSKLFDGFVKERVQYHGQHRRWSCQGGHGSMSEHNAGRSVIFPQLQLSESRRKSRSASSQHKNNFIPNKAGDHSLGCHTSFLTSETNNSGRECRHTSVSNSGRECRHTSVSNKSWLECRPNRLLPIRHDQVRPNESLVLTQGCCVDNGHLSASILPQGFFKD